MSLPGVAARLVWGSLEGLTLSDTDRALLARGLGGVVLFSRLGDDPSLVARLDAAAEAVA